MKIKWNGHASFTLTSADGTVIVTDPYDPGGYDGALTYDVVSDRADGVLISHDHADHNYVEGLSGTPVVLKHSGSVKEIAVKGMPTFHDETEGSERGTNMVYTIKADGITICFSGDLGHQLSDEQVTALGKIDVMLVPVGGFFTLDADGAAKLIETVKPAVVIPMHYKTEKCGFPIEKVDSFLSIMKDVKKQGKSEIEFTKAQIPEQSTEVWVLDHAC